MNRYPDQITIEKPTGNTNNPYGEVEYEVVYTGKCRCYQHTTYNVNTNTPNLDNYQASIPDPKMINIGENWRVRIQNTPKNVDYNGFVTYFVRYDKTCYVNFQILKNNQIDEDGE